MYGCNTRIMNKQDKNNLKVVGMWIRLLKVSWAEIESKISVLNEANV